MKKLLLLLAVCVTLTSCKWIHETFYSVEDCAEWYAEQMHDAILDDDVDEFIEVYNDWTKWYKSLGDADMKKAVKAGDEWLEKNGDEKKRDEFFKKHKKELRDRM